MALVTLVRPADLWLGRTGTLRCRSAGLAGERGESVCGMNEISPSAIF